MVRDSMGLAVKQEIPYEILDAAPVRSSPMQWSFSNKGSASPQLLSFQSSQEDNKPKTGFDSLASDYPVAQKNIVSAKQGAVRYTVTTYPTTSLHQSFVAPLATPSTSPVVGTTDLRGFSKISNSPAKLTIFYNGSVCVYENISPEKAQAIMLLAGNGPPTGSSPTPHVDPVQASMPRSSLLDGIAISKPYVTTSNRSSPVPMTSIAVPQSDKRSSIKNDTTPTKPAGVFVSSSAIAAQPQKAVDPLGSASRNFFSSVSVPQFHRKSLARFLEKRKERVTTASPYGDGQSPDCSTPRKSSRPSPVSAIN